MHASKAAHRLLTCVSSAAAVRLPSGLRLQRSFSKTDPVSALQDYCIAQVTSRLVPSSASLASGHIVTSIICTHIPFTQQPWQCKATQALSPLSVTAPCQLVCQLVACLPGVSAFCEWLTCLPAASYPLCCKSCFSHCYVSRLHHCSG